VPNNVFEVSVATQHGDEAKKWPMNGQW
jgi:hypothetical protein